MRENGEPPRLGLAACLDHEARFLETVQTFHEIRAHSFLVDGDRAAICWALDVTLRGGRRVRWDEIASQRWEGDRILCEQFFYATDPPQPPAPCPAGGEPEAWEDRGIACVVVGAGGRSRCRPPCSGRTLWCPATDSS